MPSPVASLWLSEMAESTPVPHPNEEGPPTTLPGSSHVHFFFQHV